MIASEEGTLRLETSADRVLVFLLPSFFTA
jgi:hypothetical protein